MERDSGWFCRACYHVPLFVDNLSAAEKHSRMSLHISNIYAEKRSMGKKLILTIRAVMHDESGPAGDFNGAAWRCDNKKSISTVAEAVADCGDPDRFQATGLTFVGSKNLLNRRWKVRLHGAFSIPHEALGLRPTDQSCHHEAWIHLDFCRVA